jgi:hypothetical protein
MPMGGPFSAASRGTHPAGGGVTGTYVVKQEEKEK